MKGKGESSTRILELSIAEAGISVLLVLIAIAFTSIAIVPATARSVEVRVTPESGYAEEGATFSVTINVDDVTDFKSGQFDLSFDSSVVEVTHVTAGSIDGETIPEPKWHFVDADTVQVYVRMPMGEVVSGSGHLAEVSFRVKGKEGAKSVLNLSDGLLSDKKATKIPAEWIDAELRVGGEGEEEEEEVGEEVTPGSPKITACNPIEAVVNNAVGESRTFTISVNQIVDISWQINGTDVQTNKSVTEASFTKSAVIGIWNVSAIATNTTTGLSDRHTWVWSVTLTATVTPSPTLAPGVTPPPTLAPGVTPTPKPAATTSPAAKPKPRSTPTPTPKPAVPGFEAIFAIAVMPAIAYKLLRRR